MGEHERNIQQSNVLDILSHNNRMALPPPSSSGPRQFFETVPKFWLVLPQFLLNSFLLPQKTFQKTPFFFVVMFYFFSLSDFPGCARRLTSC
jgi:hypothetical protein